MDLAWVCKDKLGQVFLLSCITQSSAIWVTTGYILGYPYPTCYLSPHRPPASDL